MTATRRLQPAWLLISVVGAIVAYRTAMDSMPPCDCFQWRYLAMRGEGLVGLFAMPAILVIVGIVASFGAGDGFIRFASLRGRREMRSFQSAKVRWSLGIAAVIWFGIFFMAVSITSTNGGNYFYSPGIVHWLLLIAAGGAFITWPVLWVALSVGEALLRVFGVPRRNKT